MFILQMAEKLDPLLDAPLLASKRARIEVCTYMLHSTLLLQIVVIINLQCHYANCSISGHSLHQELHTLGNALLVLVSVLLSE